MAAFWHPGRSASSPTARPGRKHHGLPLVTIPFGPAPTSRRHPLAVSAYVLIQTEVGKAAQVAAEVSGIDGVVSAEDVTGPYDVIVRAEAGSVDELGKMVV